MADVSPEEKRAGAATDLLFADLKYLQDAFWKNEETGEKRIQFFIALVTAVIAALAATVGKSGIQDGLHVVIIFYALFSLFIVGLVTFFRLIRRVEVTDGYKKDMDDIRERLKKYCAEDGVLLNYSPFKYKSSRKDDEEKNLLRKFGGLTDTVAAINSLILSTFFTLAFYRFFLDSIVPCLTATGLVLLVLLAFLVLFAGSCGIHVWYSRHRERLNKKSLSGNLSHNGGYG